MPLFGRFTGISFFRPGGKPTVLGGVLSSDATYYYRTFFGSGTLTVTGAPINADVLLVGGGGSGGAGTGGGGGAGGLINISGYSFVPSTFTVTVGAGGTNDDIDIGTSGANTVVTNGTRTLTAIGGGYGGSSETGSPGPTYAPANGGSGGGAQGYYSGNNTPGTSTQPVNTSDGVVTYNNTGYGNAGGAPSTIPGGGSGGGGGAGAVGANGSTGAGGAGLQLSISGTSQWYAAGGGGGNGGTTSTNGIGGYHNTSTQSGTAGATNTGSGGGGGWAHAGGYGGAGGSGIVIVRYLKAAVDITGNADYELIGTILLTVSQPSVTFAGIPNEYKHLQLRSVVRTDLAGTVQDVYMRFNGDASAASYYYHSLYGTGSAAGSEYSQVPTGARFMQSPGTSGTSGLYYGAVTDILDAFSTTKNKTVRTLSGSADSNNWRMWLVSNAWLSTTAVTSITIVPNSATNFIPGSRFSLYGVRG